MNNQQEKIYASPNLPSPSAPVTFDPDLCTGCNTCVDVCQMDMLIPNPDAGKPPLVIFPDECWYGGCCVFSCPTSGAIKLNFPLVWTTPWKRRETGELFWIGMKNPPPPNPKPPA